MGVTKTGAVRPSKLRKVYLTRLAVRCAVSAAGIALVAYRPSSAEILRGWNFFRRPSPFHVLWCVWVWDMLAQIFPFGRHLALGSQKLFRFRYRPADSAGTGRRGARDALRSQNRRAAGVFLLWAALTVVLSLLRHWRALNDGALFCVTLAFYVCDLICVLIWCPFRLMLGNRCCTTCRIFNWDHLMMFSPMLTVRGFFSQSLLALAVVSWLVWELAVLRFPERFCVETNAALRCGNCTDKLCTQYCEGWLSGRRRT